VLSIPLKTVKSAQTSVTPIQKVIDLMKSLLTKCKSEKHDEEVEFASYKQFCDDATVEKKRSTEKAVDKIDVLKAIMQKATSEADRLTKEIAAHEEDIDVWTGDTEAATTVRNIEKADYDKMHKDYGESIDALQRAISVLEKDSAGASSLVQLKTMRERVGMPERARREMQAFLEEGADTEERDTTDAYAYAPRAVIEMLEKLLDKFQSERTTLEKEEMSANHAYEMLMQDLTEETGEARQERDLKSEAKAKQLQLKAERAGDLTDLVATKNADTTYLADLVATCEQKADDFAAKQALREEEIDAIGKALEIISSTAVSGNAEKHLPSLFQGVQVSLVQVRSQTDHNEQQQAASYLRRQAMQLGSRVLSSLALRVDADPFQKVKRLIQDLIFRLQEEATGEAEQKGWCDAELATNRQTRAEKTQAVETLTAEIDQLEASIAKLSEDIAALSKAVAGVNVAMKTATSLRQQEKEKHVQAIANAQEAQTAVAQALTVLQEFYSKAGDATAFVQRQSATLGSPYKGMQSESSGIIGMLEVVQSDFARVESETKGAETSAQKEYDIFMTDSQVDKASKEKDIEHKMSKKQDALQALTEKEEDIEGTQKELHAALSYFDKLKPSCVDSGVSYDDRVARRKEELESLMQALRILNGEDIA